MLRPHQVALLSWLKSKLSERTSPETLPFSIKSKEPLLLVTSMLPQEKELNSLEPNSPEPSEPDSQLTKKLSKSSRSKRENKTSHLENSDLEHDLLII